MKLLNVFKDIHFSTKTQFKKKLPIYLPSTIIMITFGVVMYLASGNTTDVAINGLRDIIFMVLIMIGVLSLVSLIFDITIYDNNKDGK